MLDKSTDSLERDLRRIKRSGKKLLKMTENNQVVLLYEMIGGKFQVLAGTKQKLFEKLADEAVQDLEYVDTYLLNHHSFMTSSDLLDQLIDRFYMTPIPSEYEYFKKWQSSIQTKVLTVIYHWITIGFQDFENDKKLLQKLNLFRFSNSVKLFQYQSNRINFALKANIRQPSKRLGLLPNQQLAMSQCILSRRLSNELFNFDSFDSLSLTLTNPAIGNKCHTRTNLVSSYTSFMSLETEDIARYLTLADYHLFKNIRKQGIHDKKAPTRRKRIDHVQLMTNRANMLGHWIAHEMRSLTHLKPKRSLMKKWINIAKMCYELSNFHTCMVIMMELTNIPKVKEIYQSLSSKDSSTFTSLQKLIDVRMNMRYYRQKTRQAKSPAIPFLPIVLKDYTFLNENPKSLSSYPDLINFSKFIFLKQFTDKTFQLLDQPYWFSNDLSYFPFLQQKQDKVRAGPLDDVAIWIENQLDQIQGCYLQCSLLCR